MASPTTATSTAPAAVAAATTTAATVAAKTAAPAGVASAATTMAPAPKADAPVAEQPKGAEQPKKEGIFAKVTGFFANIISNFFSFLAAVCCCRCGPSKEDLAKTVENDKKALEKTNREAEELKNQQRLKEKQKIDDEAKVAEDQRLANQRWWKPATWNMFNAPITAENFKPTAKVEVK